MKKLLFGGSLLQQMPGLNFNICTHVFKLHGVLVGVLVLIIILSWGVAKRSGLKREIEDLKKRLETQRAGELDFEKLEKQRDGLIDISMILLYDSLPNEYKDLRADLTIALIGMDMETKIILEHAVKNIEETIADTIEQKILSLSTANLSIEQKEVAIRDICTDIAAHTRVIRNTIDKECDRIRREKREHPKIPF